MPRPATDTRILTANRLEDGLVLYLAPDGWTDSPFAARVARTPEDADALLAEGKAAVARNEVADAYLIDFADDGDEIGPVRKREAIRALGPTVRPDLGYQAGQRG